MNFDKELRIYRYNLESLSDIDRDGSPELMITGELRDDDDPRHGRGFCRILNTRNLSVVRTHRGSSSQLSEGLGYSGVRLGDRILNVGDQTGDGIEEYAISTYNVSGLILDMRSSLIVYDGSTGNPLRVYSAINSGRSYFQELSRLGDLDGDGFDDIVVGTSNSFRDFLDQEGEVRAISLRKFDFAFIRGDANDDGLLSISDPIKILEHLLLPGVRVNCLEALNFDDNQFLDTSDAISLLAYLFLEVPHKSHRVNTCHSFERVNYLNLFFYLGCESSSCEQR